MVQPLVALCHQDNVYTASYAAVPHVVGIAQAAAEPIDLSFLLLPAAVEIARRNGRGPALPTELADAYFHALSDLPDVVSRHRDENSDEPMLRVASAAMAVARGDIASAEALLDGDDA